MPPKGTRICFDKIRCEHGNNASKQCKRCLDQYAKLIANDEAYLCLECRGVTQRRGYSWPKKGSGGGSKTINSAPKKAADFDKMTCSEHKYKFDSGRRCEKCLDEFQRIVGQCSTCNGYDPDDKNCRICKKHTVYWQGRKLLWSHPAELLAKATPYPIGATEDFLNGMEICLAPRKK
jgi:hypothetical protein